jgi:hypothetical protein
MDCSQSFFRWNQDPYQRSRHARFGPTGENRYCAVILFKKNLLSERIIISRRGYVSNMDLREVLNTISSSRPADWHHIACWGAFSGPSYRDHISFNEVYGGQPNVVTVESHSDVAIYIPDVDISIAWGIECNDNYREPWANQFPDPQASSGFVDVFYRNALVYRDVYVLVDGARTHLPSPRGRDGALQVSDKRRRFFKLIDSIERVSEFDRYFQDVNFAVVDVEWLDREG